MAKVEKKPKKQKLSRQEKKEQKQKAKELKKYNKEHGIETEEDEDEEGGSKPLVAFMVFFIILIWLGILGLLIKLDIGGLGSSVLRPLLQNIPVVNKILPAKPEDDTVQQNNTPYKNLDEAVEQIKSLEKQLQAAQSSSGSESDKVSELQAEVDRLKVFEQNQINFEALKAQFDQEVVFGASALTPEEYKKYYESIDPANAEQLYKQVVSEEAGNEQVQDYAKAYSEMKPAQAAGIFESMTDNMELAAEILNNMDTKSRGAILGAMTPEVAAKLTKIMAPS